MAERLPFDTNLAHSQHAAFRLLYVSPLSFQSGYKGHMHAHPCVEIFFILRGRGAFFIRNERIRVAEDDLVIVNPSVEHTEAGGQGASMDYIVIGLEGAAFLIENQSQGYFFGSFREHRRFFRELLSVLTREVENKEERYQEVCGSLMDILLAYIWRMTGLQIVGEEKAQGPAQHRITWVKQYLDDHFTHDINLDDLSAKVCLNKYSIVRLFKQTYGISPMRYVIDRRFDEARFYLKTSSLSVKQIAELSGFNSANYFSQMFQKCEGVSPTAYRRIYQKGAGSGQKLQAEALGIEGSAHGQIVREEG